MLTTQAEVAKEIDTLLHTHDFPIPVLQDIHHRLQSCQDAAYAEQQLRYLQRVIQAGHAKPKAPSIG